MALHVAVVVVVATLGKAAVPLLCGMRMTGTFRIIQATSQQQQLTRKGDVADQLNDNDSAAKWKI